MPSISERKNQDESLFLNSAVPEMKLTSPKSILLISLRKYLKVRNELLIHVSHASTKRYFPQHNIAVKLENSGLHCI